MVLARPANTPLDESMLSLVFRCSLGSCRFRSTNILVRIYKRSRAWAVLFFITSLILLFFVRSEFHACELVSLYQSSFMSLETASCMSFDGRLYTQVLWWPTSCQRDHGSKSARYKHFNERVLKCERVFLEDLALTNRIPP